MEKDQNSMDLSMIVDHDRISKNSALDLVELAQEIEKANNYVKDTACTKLRMIVDQVRHLHKQAKIILTEAKRNEILHNVSCNFVKHPGHVYHLYERNSGELYFSMLSPQEWGNSGPSQQHKGSFRMEFDRSWTPLSEIQNVNEDMKIVRGAVESSEIPKVPFFMYSLNSKQN